MLTIKKKDIPGYETVIEAVDQDVGLHCFIAIHNSVLGPTLGGVRIRPYESTKEALDDSLRLSKAMTYKSAIAELGLGGGKSTIIANPESDKTPRLLEAFGKVINSLQGAYIAAEDVGSTIADMEILHHTTPYVAALMGEKSSGDPSHFTAWGVLRSMHATAEHLWKSPSLVGKTIAIQGLGSVGKKLAYFLFWEGANLIVSDIDEAATKNAAHLYGAKIIDNAHYAKIDCDILSPCALGGIVNHDTVNTMKCKAIVGSANNQLQESALGEVLMGKGILYAPDFIANAGGIINASIEFNPEGYNPILAREKTEHLYEVLLTIFNQSEMQQKPTNLIADELAEYNISHGIGKRMCPISFYRRR